MYQKIPYPRARAHTQAETLLHLHLLTRAHGQYFIQRYGIRKIAKQKLGMFLGAVYQYHDANRRIQIFGIFAGLFRTELYSPHLGDAFFNVLRRIFAERENYQDQGVDTKEKNMLANVKEMLGGADDDDSRLVVVGKDFCEALVGTEGEGVKYMDKATWAITKEHGRLVMVSTHPIALL